MHFCFQLVPTVPLGLVCVLRLVFWGGNCALATAWCAVGADGGCSLAVAVEWFLNLLNATSRCCCTVCIYAETGHNKPKNTWVFTLQSLPCFASTILGTVRIIFVGHNPKPLVQEEGELVRDRFGAHDGKGRSPTHQEFVLCRRRPMTSSLAGPPAARSADVESAWP